MLAVYPAAATAVSFVLLALFVVAGGITVLQVAANPYISVLGGGIRLSEAQPLSSVQFIWHHNCACGRGELPLGTKS